MALPHDTLAEARSSFLGSRVRVGLMPLVVLLSLFGVNCGENSATQLVVLMDTDYAVPAEVDRIRARVAKVVEDDAGARPVQTWERVFAVSNDDMAPSGSYALPATFAILADAPDVDREVIVELDALANGSDQAIGTRRVRTGFITGEARLLRMLIHRACEGVTCGANQSCGCPNATSCPVPSCVDEWVPPEMLEPIDDPGALPPNSEFPDGGVPPGGGGNGGGAGSGGAGGSSGSGGAGGADCGPPLTRCNDECVNTSSDPRFCGSCDVACPRGYVCEASRCLDPGDCRTNGVGCSGFTYCDEGSGNCLVGCTIDEQCGRDHEVCNTETHLCVCDVDFERCGFDCVDVQNDPGFCGGCVTSCPQGEVCESGSCIDPGDCRTNQTGCIGFTYCDEASGNCLRGCTNDLQCTGANRVCDTDLHECVCAEGFHSCGGSCVSDLEVESCGTSCTPCPSPPGSTPTCEGGVCGLVCEVGLEQCASECVDTQTDPRFCGDCLTSCPAGDECDAGGCVDPGDCRTNGVGCSGFTYCDLLSGNCLTGCASNAQCTDVNEVCNTVTHECVCATGFHSCGEVCVSDLDANSCGTSCTPCPSPPNATATCESGTCDFLCDDTFERCGNACCPTSCPAGQVLFEAECAAVHLRIANDQGNVGEYASLAVDSSGTAHLACYARNGKNLLYSRWQATGLWTSETAASTNDVGQHGSIGLDATGAPRIAYYDADAKNLAFARRVSGVWTRETVHSQGDVGQYASLAFDLAGSPRIAYYDETNKDLLLASRQTGGIWSIERIDGQDDVGRFASLAFDPTGNPFVAYYDESNKDLLVAARQPNGTWMVEVVDGPDDVGSFASLAFDPLGTAHVSYYDETNKDLLIATREGAGSWKIDTVDVQGDVGSHGSLAFDGAGTAHISYFDETNKDLKHASRRVGQTWKLRTIDSAGDVGTFTSIALDAEGNAHVGYYDATNTNLKYALIAAPQ